MNTFELFEKFNSFHCRQLVVLLTKAQVFEKKKTKTEKVMNVLPLCWEMLISQPENHTSVEIHLLFFFRLDIEMQ